MDKENYNRTILEPFYFKEFLNRTRRQFPRSLTSQHDRWKHSNRKRKRRLLLQLTLQVEMWPGGLRWSCLSSRSTRAQDDSRRAPRWNYKPDWSMEDAKQISGKSWTIYWQEDASQEGGDGNEHTLTPPLTNIKNNTGIHPWNINCWYKRSFWSWSLGAYDNVKPKLKLAVK